MAYSTVYIFKLISSIVSKMWTCDMQPSLTTISLEQIFFLHVATTTMTFISFAVKVTRKSNAVNGSFWIFFSLLSPQFAAFFNTINYQGRKINNKKYINSILRFKTPKGTPRQSCCETHRLGRFFSSFFCKETAEHLEHTEAEKRTDAGDRLMVRQRVCERDSQKKSSFIYF